jgi:DNA-binding NarL/FixJ family response regulator
LITRILLVDDHQPWRRGIRSMLGAINGWQIVGEAADGADAVQTAAALAPDLILLDVELPGLNGIEAAKRILARDPASRILFVSAHRSLDIVEAAFATGARGYVVKAAAAYELLPAMDTIARNGRFVSDWALGGPLAPHARLADARGAQAHEVAFYADNASMLESLTRFAEQALKEQKALIVAGGASLLNALDQQLKRRVDVDLAFRQGRYLPLHETDVFSLLVDGWPDEDRFWKAGSSLMLRAARASRSNPPRVAACGECCGLLMQDGRIDVAIRLEQLWDELARTFNVDLLCGYSMNPPAPGIDPHVFQRIRDIHSAVHSQ